MKELLKLDSICKSYTQMKGSSFYDSQCSFSAPNGMAIFRREPPKKGMECRWGRLKSRNQRLSGLAVNSCCTVVLYFALCGRLFVYGRYWTTKRDRRTIQCEIDQARSRAIHSHDGRESCIWQQGSTLRRRQQNIIQLCAPVNPKPK